MVHPTLVKRDADGRCVTDLGEPIPLVQVDPTTKGLVVNNEAVGNTSIISANTTLTAAAHNGKVLECAANVTLTIPAGLTNFGCAVMPNTQVTLASDGTALINGSTTSYIVQEAASPMFAITARSAANSYLVTGA